MSYRCDLCRTVYRDVEGLGRQFVCTQCRRVLWAERAHQPDLLAGPEDPLGQSLPDIERIRYERYLAEGAMGEVYRAMHTGMCIPVVVKIIKSNLSQDHLYVRQFLNEARLASRVRHPNVVRILDCNEDGRQCFIVMEFIDGESCAQRVKRQQQLRWPDAAQIVTIAARGLKALAEHNILHRDVKPSNILLGRDDSVWITDFGLAMHKSDVNTPIFQEKAVGTPAYMSPDHWHPADMDARADMYSLGATLFHLLAGTPPFSATSTRELLNMHAYAPRPSIRQIRPDVPEKLDRWIDKMMAQDRDQRYPRWDEALHDLVAIASLRAESPPALRADSSTPGPIHFEFVGYGEVAHATGKGTPRLYLDVGNCLSVGVIDHHQLSSFIGSTARLVQKHQELVLLAKPSPAAPAEAYTFVMHRQPDLDCLLASYLARQLFFTGALPPGAEALADYADRVDTGQAGFTQEYPFTLYSAYLLLFHRLSQRYWEKPDDFWRKAIVEGWELVEFALAQHRRDRVPLMQIDVFQCPGLFGPHDRAEITADRERYQAKLADPACAARRERLYFPTLFGGPVEADTLMIANVQAINDPERCLFFKDWARSDNTNSPGGLGFIVLFVYEDGLEGRGRGIISTKPESGITLQGLAGRLERAEIEKRTLLTGRDSRADGPTRPGYQNSDPWYDGRSHCWTILDSPRSGTVLSRAEIEEVLLAFCAATASPSVRETSSQTNDTFPYGEQGAGMIAQLLHAWEREKGAELPAICPSVFFSFHPSQFDWLAEDVLRPLQAELGEGKIRYLDPSSPRTIESLAHHHAQLENCLVMVPILCEKYFEDPVCVWEYETVLARDPVGQRGVICPVTRAGIKAPAKLNAMPIHQLAAAAPGETLRNLLKERYFSSGDFPTLELRKGPGVEEQTKLL